MLKKVKKTIIAVSEIFILITMSLATAFIISNQIEIVSAQIPEEDLTRYTTIDSPFKIPGLDKKSAIEAPTKATSSQILEQARNAKQIPVLLKEKARLEKDLKRYEKTLKEFSGLSDIDLQQHKTWYDETAKKLADTDKKLKDAGYGSATTAEAAEKAALPGFLGQMGLKESWGGHLLAGVIYASAAYAALEFVTNMIGLKDEQKKSVQYGVSSGVGVYQLFQAIQSKKGYTGIFSKTGTIGKYATHISVVIAVAVFLATYKKEKVEIVTFSSLPWQPPTGGRYCEECNKDPFRP